MKRALTISIGYLGIALALLMTCVTGCIGSEDPCATGRGLDVGTDDEARAAYAQCGYVIDDPDKNPVASPSSRWPQGRIPIQFEMASKIVRATSWDDASALAKQANHGDDDAVVNVQRCMAELESSTPLRFTFATEEDDVPLTISLRMHVDGQGVAGYASSVGARHGLVETLIPNGIVLFASNKSTICHELGHIIGMGHTQNRRDRNDYIRVHWNNVPLALWPQYFMSWSLEAPGHYDYKSIMHYENRRDPETGCWAFTLPGHEEYCGKSGAEGASAALPVISAGWHQHGQSFYQFSNNDLWLINHLYCRPQACSGRCAPVDACAQGIAHSPLAQSYMMLFGKSEETLRRDDLDAILNIALARTAEVNNAEIWE